MISCDRCRKEAIIYQPYAGKHLCTTHFTMDFESRAKRTIRRNRWIQPGDRVAIALSGGKDSSALLWFLSRVFGQRRDITMVGITVDEGIHGYRNLYQIQQLASSCGVEWIGGSFRETFGLTLDQVLRKKGESLSCSYCGVLRRYALNRYAREAGATRLAMGFNLDDEAQSVLMNVLRGDTDRLRRPVQQRKGLVPRIKPFRALPEREVALYAHLYVEGVEFGRCPYAHHALRGEVRSMLNEYSYRHPATKFALVNLGEELARQENASVPELRTCERCGEPCADICRSCQIIDEVTGG